MTTTANAVANIAAYGRHFRQHDGCRLRYALHGRVPYDHLVDLHPSYTARRMDAACRSMFETWFLPLVALQNKNGVPAGQLPALLKHFHRSRLLPPPAMPAAVLTGLRGRVRGGDTGWVMDKTTLAAAFTTADHSGRMESRGPTSN